MTQPWAGGSWAGSSLARQGSVGGYTVPGFTDVYYWTANATGLGWGVSTWAGASLSPLATGGVLAHPDPDAGVVTLMAWWASAQSLTLTRVTPDGTATPVRGLSPFTVTGATSRTNIAINPRMSVDLTGYSASAGTLSRLTGLTIPNYPTITTGGRITANSSGNATLAMADPVPPYATVEGMLIRTSTVATGITLSITWYDLSSNVVATTTNVPATISRSQAAGQFSYCEFAITPPSGAQVGYASLAVTGLTASTGTLDVTGRIWEAGVNQPLGSYFDGDTLGGSWRGGPGVSSSTLAPIQYVTDGEAPMDVPVTYVLSSPSLPGLSASTTAVVLDSGGNKTWMTHPTQPYAPVPAIILGPFPPLDRDIVQGVYYPLDSADGLPIVKTQSRRRGRTGTIKFLALDHGERDRLNQLFADGQPVLIRSPASYGEGQMWLSLGKTTEDNRAYYQENTFRTITAPFYEVAPPL